MDDHLTFAAAQLEGAPDELPTGPLLSGGSNDPELVPVIGAALLAYGIETDWSRGQNADAVTGSISSGLARWREMSGVHEPPSLSTAGTQADADHYIGAETWSALIGGARDKLDEARSGDEPANAPSPAFTPPPADREPTSSAPTVSEAPNEPAPQGDPTRPVTPAASDAAAGEGQAAPSAVTGA